MVPCCGALCCCTWGDVLCGHCDHYWLNAGTLFFFPFKSWRLVLFNGQSWVFAAHLFYSIFSLALVPFER